MNIGGVDYYGVKLIGKNWVLLDREDSVQLIFKIRKDANIIRKVRRLMRESGIVGVVEDTWKTTHAFHPKYKMVESGVARITISEIRKPFNYVCHD